MKALIIYHAPCWDGLAAAWATTQGLRAEHPTDLTIDYMPRAAGEAAPDVSAESYDAIYLVDLSFKFEEMAHLHQTTPTFVVLDHHISAKEEMEGLDFCTFDLARSGARLAWEHFFPDKSYCPLVIKYIEDRDLWNWDLQQSLEFSVWLRTQPMTFETLDKLSPPDTSGIFDGMLKGAAMLEYEEALVENIARGAHRVSLWMNDDDHHVYAVNTPTLVSEVGHLLATKHKVGMTYHFDADGHWKFSLRSDGTVDVSAIAKAFGGGGHTAAAGFRLPHAEVSSMFSEGTLYGPACRADSKEDV